MVRVQLVIKAWGRAKEGGGAGVGRGRGGLVIIHRQVMCKAAPAW